MPPVARHDEIPKRAWQVEYSDTDTINIESEAEMHYADAEGLERDGVQGAGFAEVTLTRLLAKRLKD